MESEHFALLYFVHPIRVVASPLTSHDARTAGIHEEAAGHS